VFRLLQRRILRELLINATGTLAATLVLIFLVSLSLQIGRVSFDDLPMTAVLKSVSLFVVHTLNLTLPLAVLSTCLFTYGRAAADGEFAAARTSGVHPWHFLSPALLLGTCVMTLLAALQDRVMPDAHFAARFVGDAVLADVDRVLHGADRRLRQGDFVAQWRERTRDEDGRLVLTDLYLAQFEKGALASETTAARARPSLTDDGSMLVFALTDVHRSAGAREGVISVGSCEVTVDLGALAAERSFRRKAVQLSNEELHGAVARDPSSQTARRAKTELHYRAALALSAPLFALFGAPLGLRLRFANRAFVFLTGVLVVVLGYWPLVAIGKRLADSGAAPAWLALNVANATLLLVGLKLARSACRS
jgi:lipopolysaccharide export LptBFGC system permease protein LptF